MPPVFSGVEFIPLVSRDKVRSGIDQTRTSFQSAAATVNRTPNKAPNKSRIARTLSELDTALKSSWECAGAR
jgi:hypothetical protein